MSARRRSTVTAVLGERFDRELAADPATLTSADPGSDQQAATLLTALKGKDVLLVFVESYGHVALTDPSIAPGITSALREGAAEMATAGYATSSGWLTSSTFGGSSWLPHATLQSGLWVDNQARYDQLVGGEGRAPQPRTTLTSAFGEAGWRTAVVLPSVEKEWPEGQAFYRFDTMIRSAELDYHGPDLGWGTIPDQFTLGRLPDLLLDPPSAGTHQAPLMAEVDLVSSHLPWPPPQPLLGWDELGDGSVYDCMPGCGRDLTEVEGMDHVGERYADAVEYSLRSLTSFIAGRTDGDLVVVMLGDHQPWSHVSGTGAGHDVPVTIITADQAVLARTDGWGWTSGPVPAADAAVWRMDEFRDRFLTTFSGG